MAQSPQTTSTGQAQGRQMRITDIERSIIRNTFKGNAELLKLMRKVFLPEYDPEAPLGQVIDLWMTVKIDDKDPEAAYTHLVARNQLINHVDSCLMQLNTLAEMEDDSFEQALERTKKNSSK